MKLRVGNLILLFFLALSWSPLVTGACTFPGTVPGTSWWQGYSTAGTDLLRKYATNTVTIDTTTGTDSYTCSLDPAVVGGFYYYSWQGGANINICVEELYTDQAIFFRDGDPAKSNADCVNKVSGNPNVAIKYPFDFSASTCDPLPVGAYQTEFNPGTGAVCVGEDSSIMAIEEKTITFKMCPVAGTNAYKTPVDVTLTCVQQTPASTYSQPAENGDIMILTGNVEGKQRFYCGRYLVDPTTNKPTISLGLTMDTLGCDLAQTSTSAETDKYVSYSSTPIECLADYCMNGGTCVVTAPNLVLTYDCTCPTGFTGSICETAVDPCASSPCTTNQTCVTKSATEYICNDPGTSSDFPWLPIVIAIGAALLFALLAGLIYACCRYCCVPSAVIGDVANDAIIYGSKGALIANQEKMMVNQGPTIAKRAILDAPMQTQKVYTGPLQFRPGPIEQTKLWRSEAVYTPGLQYPHAIVGDYPLDPNLPVDVMVPFTDGSVEVHPAYLPHPAQVNLRPIEPPPRIVAELGPQPIASEIRHSREPLIIQELDDQGRLSAYADGVRNDGLIIGDDRHVNYEFVNI